MATMRTKTLTMKTLQNRKVSTKSDDRQSQNKNHLSHSTGSKTSWEQMKEISNKRSNKKLIKKLSKSQTNLPTDGTNFELVLKERMEQQD